MISFLVICQRLLLVIVKWKTTCALYIVNDISLVLYGVTMRSMAGASAALASIYHTWQRCACKRTSRGCNANNRPFGGSTWNLCTSILLAYGRDLSWYFRNFHKCSKNILGGTYKNSGYLSSHFDFHCSNIINCLEFFRWI